MTMAGLVFAVLFWAINTVVAKGVITQVPPMSLSFYRWVTAMLFLTPFAVVPLKKDLPVIRKNLGKLFWLALPSVAIYNSVLYVGALYTTATNISLVVAAMPTAALGLAWAITGDRPRPLQVLGIGLAMVGVLAIVLKGSWQTVVTLNVNPGDLLVLISIFAWAVYSVMLRKNPLPLHPLSFLMMTFILGTLIIVPFYLGEFILYRGFTLDGRLVGVFVYLGICPSILSYICWNHGVRVLGAPTASVFIYLVPVFASVMAWFFLGEAVYGFHLWGGSLILGGLLLSSFSNGEK
jgi:drug/metabolite transporter (DMT)-like permease